MLKIAEERLKGYNGSINAQVMDAHNLDFPDNHFDQIYTSCTFCSVPNPVKGLESLYRVLKPGGELRMFEHTGSRYFPFNVMMHFMTLITSRFGPDMNRTTVNNVEAAGFEVLSVKPVYLDVVKTITARKSA
jgi:ubiquinone/menaquinone biosynthesis C-methylase UbiE